MKELGVVRIASPCRKSWDSMPGDDRVRFCRGCKQNVYNLSELTADDARALLLEEEGRLCVRFWARADGRVITKDCPVGVRWRTWKWVALATALVNVIAATLWAALGRTEPAPTLVDPKLMSRTGGVRFSQNNNY